jgi:hypothetical protein
MGKSGGRILLGDNASMQGSHTAADQITVCLSLDFNLNSLCILIDHICTYFLLKPDLPEHNYCVKSKVSLCSKQSVYLYKTLCTHH